MGRLGWVCGPWANGSDPVYGRRHGEMGIHECGCPVRRRNETSHTRGLVPISQSIRRFRYRPTWSNGQLNNVQGVIPGGQEIPRTSAQAAITWISIPKIHGSRCHNPAYVRFGSEPQGTTESKTGSQGLGDKPPSVARIADLQWRIQGTIRCTMVLARADRSSLRRCEWSRRFGQATTIVAVHEAATHTARSSATETRSASSFRDRRIGFSSR